MELERSDTALVKEKEPLEIPNELCNFCQENWMSDSILRLRRILIVSRHNM